MKKCPPQDTAGPRYRRPKISHPQNPAGPQAQPTLQFEAAHDVTRLPVEREMGATPLLYESWRLQIANCSLDITQEQAISCLAMRAPRGVLMIGDSLTRYQYLSLAYYLVTGRWRIPHPSNAAERECWLLAKK